MSNVSEREFTQQYGPWALVAGGALGLGEAWCNELARRGLNIVSLDRDQEALTAQAEHLASTYGVDVRTKQVDLADRGILEIAKGLTEDIEIGLMVFSAAMTTDPEIVRPHLFLEGSLDHQVRVVGMNAGAVTEFCHHFGGLMVERERGGLVLVTSGAANQGTPFNATYGASKAYQTNLAEGLWYEMKPYNVNVIAAPLGLTNTTSMAAVTDEKMLKKMKPMDPTESVQEILQALGTHPRLTPGRKNRFQQFVMSKLMPRKKAIQTMGDILVKGFLKDEDYGRYRK